MGLENLKSIFSGDIGVNKSIHSGRHNNPDESYEQHGIIASQLNIDGTTPIFQTPFELGYGDYAGYATDKPDESYEQHGIIASQLNIDGTTPIFQTPFELGYGDYAGFANGSVGDVNPENTTFGMKFTNSIIPSNLVLNTSNNGIFTSLNYINNATGQHLSIDGTMNTFLGSVGIGTQISSPPPKYEDTVLERTTAINSETLLSTIIPTEVTDDYLYPYRGIVFQVQDERNLDNHPALGGRVKFIKRRIPLSESSMFENMFQSLTKITGLDDIINIDLPNISITGGKGIGDLDWGSNFSPKIDIDIKALAENLKELYERLKSSLSNIKSPISFKLPDIGKLDLGLSLPKINLPSLKGLKAGFEISKDILSLSKDIFGTITMEGGSILINDAFADFKNLINHPGYGKYGGATDIRISPRALVNPKAGHINGDTTKRVTGEKFDINKTRPGSGPYSRLQAAASDPSKHYWSAGKETGTMLGSIDAKEKAIRVGNSIKTPKGDFMTLFPISNGKFIANAFAGNPNDFKNFEGGKHGMPFYFQDLRDNPPSFILFRGYLDGINETVSPSWSSENYVGRSEPVYTYERAERSISFGLKLYAQTEDELSILYKKKNKLTSLCYPEYKKDELIGNDFSRMKPPLTKFRMGDLYGSANDELTGFIESLTYTVDDLSTWEIKPGSQVPKLMSVSITYKVIHLQPPSSDTTFYGLGA